MDARSLLLAVIIPHLLTYSVASVQLTFGKLSPDYSLPLLPNKEVAVAMTCVAPYPTEMATNVEVVGSGSDCAHPSVNERRIDFTTATRQNVTGAYEYSAVSYLKFGWLAKVEAIVCRAVANHSDNVLVKLSPVSVKDVDQVYVTAVPNAAPQSDALIKTDSHEHPCNVRFMVREVSSGGYHWRCTTSDDEEGVLHFKSCDTAAGCANIHRFNKVSASCVTELHNWTATEAMTTTGKKSTWKGMGQNGRGMPGVAVCVFTQRDQVTLVRALEYFYEVESVPVNMNVSRIRRIMRFSQPDIKMHKLIWMEPPPRRSPTAYYTREVFQTNCSVPGYGFSALGHVIVTRNGTRLKASDGDDKFDGDFDERGLEYDEDSFRPVWIKNVTIDFRKYGPGDYVIQCHAPVWNTTEWANHNKSIEVRDQIPLYFVSGNETVTPTPITDGPNPTLTLVCDAVGDPAPEISWHPPGIGFFANETTLIVPKNSSSRPLIICTATNQFGESISKSFNLDPENVDNRVDGLLITLGVLLAIVLVLLGLITAYIKLWWRAKDFESLFTDEEIKDILEGKKTKAVVTVRVIGDSRLDDGYTGLGLDEDAIEMDNISIGSSEASSEMDDDENEPLALDIEGLPYNSRFEVAKANFRVDFKSPLGAGQYSEVYRGFIKLNGRDKNPTPVAVKSVGKGKGREYYSALMSELKILEYIGRHENVARLIGAYSHNFQNRELYVGVELCKTSLLDFLQDNRPLDSGLVTQSHLARWASEIATGMEFLSMKRVVHADLAARNVLLSFDLQAKICDFGLARKLISNVYLKTTNAHLPWKWMAIESLRTSEFSIKSDVWGYGVTLWEIFSMGDIPYPTTDWDQEGDFVTKLGRGLRLRRPEYANEETYKIMMDCWKSNPRERPRFAQLKHFFSRQYAASQDEATRDDNPR